MSFGAEASFAWLFAVALVSDEVSGFYYEKVINFLLITFKGYLSVVFDVCRVLFDVECSYCCYGAAPVDDAV